MARRRNSETVARALSELSVAFVTAGLVIIMVQSCCTISSYFALGLGVLVSGVAAVIVGGIWCGEESERDVVENRKEE